MYTITLSAADQDDRKYLQAILRSHHERTSLVRGPNAHALNFRVVDAHGQVAGGIIANTYWNWLVIDLLALEEPIRGQGIGKQLLFRVEDMARERGCGAAHTSTYGHQALGFYQKYDYHIVGQLDNYPHGSTLYWLRKDLTHVAVS